MSTLRIGKDYVKKTKNGYKFSKRIDSDGDSVYNSGEVSSTRKKSEVSFSSSFTGNYQDDLIDPSRCRVMNLADDLSKE